MITERYTDCSADVQRFLFTFDNLSVSDKLSFLAILFDRIENGMINSEDKPNSWELTETVVVLSPIDCGIENVGAIAFELVYAANEATGGSFPNSLIIDVIDTWLKYTKALNHAEGAFNGLSFKDKLYALAEIFCRIGNGQIPFGFEQYGIDGYFAAHCTLDFISCLFPDNKENDLPF